MNYPYLPYAITQIFCIFYAVTILLHMNASIGSEHELLELRRMIFSFISYSASDLFWALNEDGLIVLGHALNEITNCISVISITLGCYFWYRFIDDRLQPRYMKLKHYDTLICIPYIVVCLLDVISMFTGWLFYVDAGGHFSNTPLFDYVQGGVNYFYLVVPTVNSVIHAIRPKQKQMRGEYITYSIYMAAPLASGLLESVLPNVPLLSLNIFLVIHLLFLTIQNRQVYNDSLTGLNNRRRLNTYLEEELTKASHERPLTVIMMDINSFKSINDNFGHIEGDNALKLFSGVLTCSAAIHSGFASRYGGDEFCLVIPGETDVREFGKEISDLLGRAQGDSPKYPVTVSIGSVICDEPGTTPEEAIASADNLMYEEKKLWHKNFPRC